MAWAASTFLVAISSRDAPCNSGTKLLLGGYYIAIQVTIDLGPAHLDGSAEDGFDFSPFLVVSSYKVDHLHLSVQGQATSAHSTF